MVYHTRLSSASALLCFSIPDATMCQSFFAVPTVVPCGAAKLRRAEISVNVDYTMNFGVVFLS